MDSPKDEVDPKPTLPQRCEYLLKEHDPKDWDPETETYPRNLDWEECMGVA